MTGSTDFDRLVTSWLETVGPPDVAGDVVAAAFVETRTLPQRRAPWPIGPRPWPATVPGSVLPWRTILVTAALVASLVAALALAAGGQPPTPVGTVESVAVLLRVPADAPGGLDLVHVRVDGSVTQVRRLTSESLGTDLPLLPYGEVSLDGWLAIALGADGAASGTWALIRPGEPARPPVFVDYVPALGGAWSPTGGLFATTTAGIFRCCSITVTDATSGGRVDLGNVSLPGGGPSILWAADGSGIVDTFNGTPRIARADGGGMTAGPRAIWWPTGSRFLRPDRAPAEPTMERAFDGAPLVASTYAADGAGTLGIYDAVEGREHTAILARQDGAGAPVVVARVPLGEDVTQIWFAGLDVTDGLIAIGSWVGQQAVPQPIRIVETATGRVTSVEGTLIGFVPGSARDRRDAPTTSP